MTRNQKTSIVKVIIAIIAIVVVTGYALFNSRIFRAGPQIIIDSPSNGSVIETSPLVQVTGTARNISHLQLNGRQIYTDEMGFFNESLLLNSGYNIMQFTAEDKFGRSTNVIWELVYTGESGVGLR